MARRERSAGSVSRALFRGGDERPRRVAAPRRVVGRTGLRQLQSLQRSRFKTPSKAALGPEAPNVPKGPLHRAGQPCAVCHRDGGEDPTFVFAGTVYRDPVEKIAVADAKVVLTDAAGHTFMTTTNCVGNFYVKTSEFSADAAGLDVGSGDRISRGTWSRPFIARRHAPSVTTTRPVRRRRAICS